jgi:uncharacterized protein (TIGR02145 family)
MRKIYLVVAVTAVFLCAAGCNDGGVESEGMDAATAYLNLINGKAVYVYNGTGNGVFTDKRDGAKYKWVTIGTQTWMAENLNYETGNSKCYDDDTKNCAKYGRLYDWETAQTVCPTGWDLPSQSEVNYLVANFGGRDVGGKLKAKSGWKRSYSSDEDGNGTDNFGFNALPGGRANHGKTFEGIKYSGYWWILGPLKIYLLGENKELSGFMTAGEVEMSSVRCLRYDD